MRSSHRTSGVFHECCLGDLQKNTELFGFSGTIASSLRDTGLAARYKGAASRVPLLSLRLFHSQTALGMVPFRRGCVGLPQGGAGPFVRSANLHSPATSLGGEAAGS